MLALAIFFCSGLLIRLVVACHICLRDFPRQTELPQDLLELRVSPRRLPVLLQLKIQNSIAEFTEEALEGIQYAGALRE